MAYDMASSKIELLVTTPVNLGISQFTWNPAMDRGLVGSSSDICASIAWLTRQGFEYPTITLEDKGQSWRLDEHFRLDPAERCTHLGRADLPAWSPDGQWIAFFASPRSIGVKDFARLDVPWNLYLMDPVEQKPRRVLANVKHPRSLAWSPDGRWLAFGGELPWRGKGLWLFAPSTGMLHRVTKEDISWLAWSPDGQQIAGIDDLPYVRGKPLESEVWLFDVSGLVGEG
jgi:dipeptidyl aminopeptidase/acylaminoacyl peptidase